MSHTELQDALQLYSMITFWDGRKEPGMLISRFNIPRAAVEYFFVAHQNIQAYKNAMDSFDRELCLDLIEPIVPEDVLAIHAVSLRDFKSIMQQPSIHEERRAYQ